MSGGATQAFSGVEMMPAPMAASLEDSQRVPRIETFLRTVSPALRGHRIEPCDYFTQRQSKISRTRAVVDRTRAITQQ